MNDKTEKEVETADVINYARQLTEDGRYDEAIRVCESILYENPDHGPTVILVSYISWKCNKTIFGYHFGKRAIDICPHESLAYFNYALNATELWKMEDGISAMRQAERLANDDHIKSTAHMNLSGFYVDIGKFREAEKHAREALKLNPYSPKSKANLGFALLGQRNWEGWEYYSFSLGLGARQKQKFAEEPDWDFTPGQTVVVYGEQGVGDEINFASMIPDAAKDCKKLIFSCDKKLRNLFARSFPNVKVYGTRKAKASDGITWDEGDSEFDASLALGELGVKYRRKDEDFTGEPFLVADPDKRVMWRALFDRKKKPCIGIAWTGGIPKTGKKFRTIDLEKLSPILESVPAHWVSLQYKDAEEEIAEFRKSHPSVDIVQYEGATLTRDYDDTAAMVAELDLVICIQTAVAHLAGGLGKECWVLLPKYSQWRYGETDTRTPWYKTVEAIRQRSLNDWTGPFGEIVGRLRRKFAKPLEKVA